jgi:ubiquinone biosynthesis protein Coq4
MKISIFLKFRRGLLKWLVENTSGIYLKTKSNQLNWIYNACKLHNFPLGSLGKELADFLNKNQVDLIPKAESHDVFHVITGFGIESEEEVAMQYWLLGNGRFKPYTIGACIVGMILLPDFWMKYLKSFKQGKDSPSIVGWDFEEMLYADVNQIKCYVQQTPPLFIKQSFI